MQNWVVRSASEVEQNIVSVERILHQTEIEPEAPQELPDSKPSDAWPTDGNIEFRYPLFYCLSHGHLSHTLQKLFDQISSRIGPGSERCFCEHCKSVNYFRRLNDLCWFSRNQGKRLVFVEELGPENHRYIPSFEIPYYYQLIHLCSFFWLFSALSNQCPELYSLIPWTSPR